MLNAGCFFLIESDKVTILRDADSSTDDMAIRHTSALGSAISLVSAHIHRTMVIKNLTNTQVLRLGSSGASQDTETIVH